MKTKLQSKVTAILVAMGVLLTGVNLTQAAIATPLVQGGATKQENSSTPTSYRKNYESAIARGIINRPSTVEDENQAIKLERQALKQGDRDEAAIRFAQALVIISEKDKDGTLKALAFEKRLDADILEQQRQTLRGFLPLFKRIFPE